MEHTDVLVIGGSAAGLVSALAAKSHYPNKDVLLIRKEEKAVIPCGIPYIFGTLNSSEEDLLPDAELTNAGIEIRINEVITINGKQKKCLLKDYSEITFDKLILATGSIPKIPSWLKGAHLQNVFTVPKDLKNLDVINEKLNSCEKIVLIGAGLQYLKYAALCCHLECFVKRYRKNGSVVVSGCAHSGICNMIEHAKKVTGVNRIKAVIGGFHLKSVLDKTLKTIEYMLRNNIQQIFPSHRTMEPALSTFYKTFGHNEVMAGQEIIFK